ncbi:unnamed protein product [Onchocerca flexuosa]|uniref:Uncharacterized protein n=1 Tax=Onchocerca flexuosa TaxID=387005 RepID=A0A183HKA3_9BILA|nr:unnamed protein product [Onchocerca flexuosa]
MDWLSLRQCSHNLALVRWHNFVIFKTFTSQSNPALCNTSNQWFLDLGRLQKSGCTTFHL